MAVKLYGRNPVSSSKTMTVYFARVILIANRVFKFCRY